MIKRSHPQENFKIIPNATLLDLRLSLEAQGLLVRLLARPDDWEIIFEPLKRECGIGKDKLQKLLKELRDTGYLQHSKRQEESDGHWIWSTVLTDTPSHSIAGKSGSGKNRSGKSGYIPITDGNQNGINTNNHHHQTSSQPNRGQDQEAKKVDGGGKNLIPFPSQNQNPGIEKIEDEYLRLCCKYYKPNDPESFCKSKRKIWQENGGLSKRDRRQLEHWRKLEAGDQEIDKFSNDTIAQIGFVTAFCD